LRDLIACFDDLLGVSARIENGVFVVEADIEISFSENEPGGMMEALGLHPIMNA